MFSTFTFIVQDTSATSVCPGKTTKTRPINFIKVLFGTFCKTTESRSVNFVKISLAEPPESWTVNFVKIALVKPPEAWAVNFVKVSFVEATEPISVNFVKIPFHKAIKSWPVNLVKVSFLKSSKSWSINLIKIPLVESIEASSVDFVKISFGEGSKSVSVNFVEVPFLFSEGEPAGNNKVSNSSGTSWIYMIFFLFGRSIYSKKVLWILRWFCNVYLTVFWRIVLQTHLIASYPRFSSGPRTCSKLQ